MELWFRTLLESRFADYMYLCWKMVSDGKKK